MSKAKATMYLLFVGVLVYFGWLAVQLAMPTLNALRQYTGN